MTIFYPRPIAHTLGFLTFGQVIALPAVLLLWPLVALNYSRRMRKLSADEWYWADRWMLYCGWSMCWWPR
jgi:hypothetical protein